MDTDDEDSNKNYSYIQDTFISNSFARNEVLSQGVREYVASRIAEALKEHDEKQADTIVTRPIHINIHLNVPIFTGAISSSGSQVAHRRQNVLEGPKTILALPIKDMKLARMLQIVVLGCYIAITLALIVHSVVLFARTFVVFLLSLGIYAAATAIRQSSHNVGNDSSSDLLLAPIQCIAGYLFGKSQRCTRMAIISAMAMFVEALRGMTEDVKVDPKAE
jgi:hypothetical protein